MDDDFRVPTSKRVVKKLPKLAGLSPEGKRQRDLDHFLDKFGTGIDYHTHLPAHPRYLDREIIPREIDDAITESYDVD